MNSTDEDTYNSQSADDETQAGTTTRKKRRSTAIVPPLTIPPIEAMSRSSSRSSREHLIDMFIRVTNPILVHLIEFTQLLDNHLSATIRSTIQTETYHIRNKYSPEHEQDPETKRSKIQELQRILHSCKNLRLIGPMIDLEASSAYTYFISSFMEPIRTSGMKYINDQETLTIKDFMSSTDLRKILKLNSYYLPEACTSFRDRFEDVAKEFMDQITIKDEEYDNLLFLIECQIFFAKEAIRIIIYIFNNLNANWSNALSLWPDKCFSDSLTNHRSTFLKNIKSLQKWMNNEYYKDIRENLWSSITNEKETVRVTQEIFETFRCKLNITILSWQGKLGEIEQHTNSSLACIAQQLIPCVKRTSEIIDLISELLQSDSQYHKTATSLEQEIIPLTSRTTRKPLSAKGVKTPDGSRENSPGRLLAFFTKSTDGSTSPHPTPPVTRAKSAQPESKQQEASDRASMLSSAPAKIYSEPEKQLLLNKLREAAGKESPVVPRKGRFRPSISKNSRDSSPRDAEIDPVIKK